MRIGMNLLHARPEIGGGWNYIRNIVNVLGQFDQENEYVCYCTASSACLVPNRPNFSKEFAGITGCGQVARVVYENTWLQWKVVRDRIDVMHWFANTRALFSTAASVVTVYDLITYSHPESHGLLKAWFIKTMLPFSVNRATVLAPISQWTADGLKKMFGADTVKMVIISNPVREEYQPRDSGTDQFRNRYHLPPRFWLYVAHFYPHKNHQRLLKAYQLLRSRDPDTWPLVLRGDKPRAAVPDASWVEGLGLKDHVLLLPAIPDEEMPLLYSSASALVFPSLEEGLGIPLIEAMACGCPVAASEIPTTLEFGGQAVITFKPEDVEDIARAMGKLARDEALRRECREEGFKKVAAYRPERVFKTLMHAYSLASLRRTGFYAAAAP